MLHYKAVEKASENEGRQAVKIPFLNNFSDCSEFQFDCSDISRLRKEIKVLIHRLSKTYLCKIKGNETACDSLATDSGTSAVAREDYTTSDVECYFSVSSS